MLRLRRATCFALSLLTSSTSLVTFGARPAAAQPTARPARVRDALSGDALAAFDRAASLFAAGDFGPARAEFQRAHDASHEPRVLYNVAVCDKQLGHYARAIASLRASLAEGGATLPRAYVDTVNDTITLLQPLVTTLALDAAPPGASVFVDNEPIGVTPLDPSTPIDVGEHDIAVRLTDYKDFVRHVTALGGSPLVVHATLEPLVKHGELSVTVSGLPQGRSAAVLMDGGEVGVAPWSGTVEAGPHLVAVRAAGLGAPARQVAVLSGKRVEVAFALSPLQGRLNVTVDTPDALVRVDGQVVGHGGFFGPIPSGEHALLVARPDGSGTPYRADFSLLPDETRTMNIQLSSHGEVPAWVWIGGGVLVAAGITVAVLVLTSTTKYDANPPGTLNPRVQPAGFQVGAW